MVDAQALLVWPIYAYLHWGCCCPMECVGWIMSSVRGISAKATHSDDMRSSNLQVQQLKDPCRGIHLLQNPYIPIPYWYLGYADAKRSNTQTIEELPLLLVTTSDAPVTTSVALVTTSVAPRTTSVFSSVLLVPAASPVAPACRAVTVTE